MAGRFSKQAAPQLTFGAYINSNNSGDAIIGGAQSSQVATQIGASQWTQNIPGDRFIFTPSDALALSNTSAFGGNLFTGTYRYVAAKNNSTSEPQPGRAAFWNRPGNNGNNDALYEVTSDENATLLALFAGVYINWIPLGASGDYYWFIQESGKTTVQFAGNNGTALFGNANLAAPAAGAGVYLAGQASSNSNNTVGLFTQATSGNLTDALLTHYVGPAETLPSNGNYSIVDVNFRFYRW